MNSTDVFKFIESGNEDVFIFSPIFDQSAYFINIFEQASQHGNNMYGLLEKSIKVINEHVNISKIIMDSTSIVFCNYFVAKKVFWDIWLKYCELIYSIAENNDSPLARELNSETNHDGGVCPAKVFVIERVASFILATRSDWSVKNFNPMGLPYLNSLLLDYDKELRRLDDLKFSYNRNKFPEYMEEFKSLRAAIITDLQGNDKDDK